MKLTIKERLNLGLYYELYHELKLKKKFSIDEKIGLAISAQFFERDKSNVRNRFEELIEARKEDYDLLHEYSLCLLRMGLYEEAFERLEGYHKLIPSSDFIGSFIAELLHQREVLFKGSTQNSTIEEILEKIFQIIKK